MNVYYSMKKEDVRTLLARSDEIESEEVSTAVREILEQVRTGGEEVVKELTRTFDGVVLSSLLYDRERIGNEARQVPAALASAIATAARNIETFHASQRPMHEKVEVQPGVTCWQKSVPIERVGLYIPGGTAPLFSTLLMLAIPAKLAGCSSITIATPPRADGSVDPTILYCAQLLGIEDILTCGGAQAIGALAYGTESNTPVDKIYGPGNRYVTEAKQQVNASGVAIDMPAGPSEVMVVVDTSTPAQFAAADILSQCEHGRDSQAVLVVLDKTAQAGEAIVQEILDYVNTQIATLSHRSLAESSLSRSYAVIVESEGEVVDIINEYAPEHLILALQEYHTIEKQVVNAGSVFLGLYSPESAGDYASGTNHTLPTSGYARAYGGVNLSSFMKTITYQHLSPQGLTELSQAIITMAEAETLQAHARAVSIRLDALKGV
ncbi:MAG: histidinol dehydrogenase [Sphaerochaetaceae bacterium]|nr:histidinol dehydrogenase [Sphaerochaetaceae bacterium]